MDWSDPNRESVGARRARKQKKDSKGQEGTDRDSGDQDGNRTSESVRSSVSSADKQFGFFGGKHSNKKKGSTSSRKDKTKSIASSSLRAPTLDEQSEDQSTSSVPSSVIRRAAASDDERPLSIPRSKRFSSKFDPWNTLPRSSIPSISTAISTVSSIPVHKLFCIGPTYLQAIVSA